MTDLLHYFHLPSSSLSQLTTAVQLGFICGTLFFAYFAIADRFPPSRVFFISASIAALFNVVTIFDFNTLNSLFIFRFFTGFFLAGIYPIGMKIAADHFDKGLGKSLGYLVGALVLGTAFPHFLQSLSNSYLPWKSLLISTSILAVCGGFLMALFVPIGPYRKKGGKLNLSGLSNLFKNKKFTSAAVGYFGHMWELYAFWAFVPVIITRYASVHSWATPPISLLSFSIIAIGALACVISGYISLSFGTKRTAHLSLFLSFCCCLISPFIFLQSSPSILIIFLFFWGIVVIADSPLFSTLVAQSVPASIKGTALTLVNCIGFSITILSILAVQYLLHNLPIHYVFMFLGIGPLLGVVTLFKK